MIMNKEKIGNFIRKNREDHGLTREELMYKLNDDGLEIGTNAIGQWERGETLPELDNLLALCKIFHLTIDELLEAERFVDIDFTKKYPLSNDRWYLDVKNPKDFNFRKYKFNQIKLIKNNYDSLIGKFLECSISHNETQELEFIINNFYEINEYYTDKDSEKSNFIYLKKLLNEIRRDDEKTTIKEKLFFLRNVLMPNKNIRFDINSLEELSSENDDPYIANFKDLESWQKDLIFSLVQKYDFVQYHPEIYGSKAVKNAEVRSGKPYDIEQKYRDIISYMIKNGACINPFYFNYLERHIYKARRIDRLEKIFIDVKAPLNVRCYHENEKDNFFHIENNANNRFFCKYYETLNLDSCFEPDELYKMFLENETAPNEYLLKLAKANGLDEGKETKDIIIDAKARYDYTIKQWIKFRKEYFEFIDEENEYDEILEKIKNKDLYYDTFEDDEVGGDKLDELFTYRCYWNAINSLETVMSNRDITKTKQLLKELPNLTLKEIKDKYFPIKVEVVNHE